jgi:acetyl esterase/lipase
MNRVWPVAFGCLGLLLVGGLYAQNTDTPKKLIVEKGIVYGKGGTQDMKLDLARPTGKGPFPAIVCIHGGAWTMGDRADLSRPTGFFGGKSLIEMLAEEGYVAATVSYRLAPAAKFPAQIEDCKAAVRFLRKHAEKYAINPDKIGAVGFSAGGHLACLLGVCRPEDNLEGMGGCEDCESAVQAVCSFFGPTDLTTPDMTNDLVVKSIMEPWLGFNFKDNPEVYRKASPVCYVNKKCPPFLFIHGTRDPVVNLRHSHDLAKKLTELGISAKVIEIKDAGHGWGGKNVELSSQKMLEFFRETLK